MVSAGGFAVATAQPAGDQAEAPAPDVGEDASPVEEPAGESVPGTVLVGKIDGEIDLVASAYLSRLLSEAERRSAPAVVLELNTFGGRVDAAVAMRDQLLDAERPTIVFINKRAISAGALISLACETIAISPGGTIGAATPVMSGPGTEVPQPVEEKYLSYFRQEMRVTAEARGRNGDVAEAMVDSSLEVEGVSEAGKLLTLTTGTALETGIADFEAHSVEEVLEHLGYAPGYEVVDRTWSEGLVGFLTSTSIASLLFLGMVVFGYMEFQAPGFGLFGGLAIACFMILFFSHYLVNLAGWEELLLFAIGIALLALEIFVIPGFGVAGVAGILCILVSAVMLFQAGDWGDVTLTNPFTLDAVLRVFLSTALGLAVMLVLIRFLPDVGASGRAGRLVLGTTLAGEQGYTSHDRGDTLEGVEGAASTPLRPSGRALLAGNRIEVVTEGDFIAKGERVRVVRVEDSGRVVVRRAEEV